MLKTRLTLVEFWPTKVDWLSVLVEFLIVDRKERKRGIKKKIGKKTTKSTEVDQSAMIDFDRISSSGP